MSRNMFRMNQNENDEDSKRLKDVVGRNQTRNFNSPFFHANEEQIENSSTVKNDVDSINSNQTEQIVENQGVETSNVPNFSLSSLVGKTIPFTSKKGQEGNSIGGSLVGEIFGFNKIKLLLIGCSFFAFIVFLTAIVTMNASSAANRIIEDNVIKKFTSIKNENDESDSEWNLPEVGNMSFDEYFNKNVKKPLLKYLKSNGYCDEKSTSSEEINKVDCENSEAFEFYKRYMKVTYEFEKKGYPIDTGLIYETMAYYRSDEELFSGSLKKQKVTGWTTWIQSLFKGKTDEISKLANKTWREFYIYDEEGKVKGTEWRRSLDKYVAYLMFGDSMHDKTEDPKVGTDNDLNIEGVGSSNSGESGSKVSGSHSYTYGNCSASDTDYEGIIEQGYIYNRFKDTHLLHGKKGKALEESITLIIQQILNDTIKMYGAPSYCSNSMGVGEYVPGSCSAISINHTDFSRSEFVKKVEAYANSSSKSDVKTLAKHAGDIYDMAVLNNLNPEMVFIRAGVEGYSPGGSTYNYYGMGCSNKCPSCCKNYTSVMEGVSKYLKNISQYKSVEEMMGRYAYIGDAWFHGSSSKGGCYYFPYIASYYSDTPEAQASKARAKAACDAGGDSSVKTTKYDQEAYTRYQMRTMVATRKIVFGKGADTCIGSDSGIGAKAAKYAIEKFDSYGYSQSRRMSDGYVDCSSLVYRTYINFNINFGGASSATGELQWCQKNNKMIKESELQVGDLVFVSGGTGASHVEIYIGNGKTFGAHGQYYDKANTRPRPFEEQVSIANLGHGYYTKFCRPY